MSYHKEIRNAQNLIKSVKALYDDSQCSVIELIKTVITEDTLGCFMSSFLFLFIIDWVMQQSKKKRTGNR